jgi:cyclopropane fatty-acyl-phospholipid synthase-like methyltransferase
LASHDDIYNEAYYDSIDDLSERSADAIADTICRDIAPKTLLDVGCGSGALLAAVASRGVRAIGLDYSETAMQVCRKHGLTVHKVDLRSPTNKYSGLDFDVVISMEVAEHLPRSAADRFIDFLTTSGRTIVFTAATPGQGGVGHVNEQSHEYWTKKFQDRGFTLRKDLSLAWRDEWRARGTANWYFGNVMIFASTSSGRALANDHS